MRVPPLALYAHIPWCLKKCPYCDFNSHAAADALPQRQYIDALLLDLDRDLADAESRSLHSIFIGGGTPSLFSPSSIGRLLEGVARRMHCPDGLEITMEANPGAAEQRDFAGFRAAGVNRLSIGAQSFNDESLRRLGRVHDAEAAKTAVVNARRAGFDNLNLDLMHSLPEQSVDDAMRDLRCAISLEPEHISHYQLTLEPNTLFYSKPPPLPDEAQTEAIERQSAEMLRAGGWRRYEISAWARRGRQCRHNLNYWEFGDYLGIGAGACSKLSNARGDIVRRRKLSRPEAYLRAAGQPDAVAEARALSAEELPLEFLLGALRLEEGCARRLFSERTALPDATLAAHLERLRHAQLWDADPERLRLTPQGRRFLNEALEEFLPAESGSKMRAPLPRLRGESARRSRDGGRFGGSENERVVL